MDFLINGRSVLVPCSRSRKVASVPVPMERWVSVDMEWYPCMVEVKEVEEGDDGGGGNGAETTSA